MTPGPWVVAEYREFGRLIIKADDGTTIIGYAAVGNDERGDARAMAAAPEMLAALMSVDAWVDGLGPFSESGTEPVPVFAQVKAAIITALAAHREMRLCEFCGGAGGFNVVASDAYSPGDWLLCGNCFASAAEAGTGAA